MKIREKINLAVALVLVACTLMLCGCSSMRAVAVGVSEPVTYDYTSPYTLENTKITAVATFDKSLMELNRMGINVGCNVKISVEDFTDTIPVVSEFIEEDGKLQLYCDVESDTVSLCIWGDVSHKNGEFPEDSVIILKKV